VPYYLSPPMVEYPPDDTRTRFEKTLSDAERRVARLSQTVHCPCLGIYYAHYRRRIIDHLLARLEHRVQYFAELQRRTNTQHSVTQRVHTFLGYWHSFLLLSGSQSGNQ